MLDENFMKDIDLLAMAYSDHWYGHVLRSALEIEGCRLSGEKGADEDMEEAG